jgi:hypothetical protein
MAAPLRVREIAWPPGAAERDAALGALEAGEVVSLPARSFGIDPGEAFLLDPAVSDGRAKNVSFDPASGRLAGTSLEGGGRAAMLAMMSRFADWAQATLLALAPRYADALQLGKTSYRPCEIEGRALSPRKDDRRLHVDAFPSQPVQGRRILRLFANVDPDGRERVWNVGEPFEPFAGQFVRRARRGPPGSGPVLQALGLTKGRRTAYDALMLQLHDLGKEDEAWQAAAPRRQASFPAGSSWIVFTDAALHAALEGRHALEQTFFLPVDAMARPELSPLKVLERLTGRALV